MNSHLRTRLTVSLAAIAGIAATALMMAPRAHADSWDKMTRLTFTEPTQVQNTYLEPGTYMFKLASSSSDRDIVQIFNSDRSHLINTVMAIPAYRVTRDDRTIVTFWETPPGTAKAVRTWYYPGDNYGQEFRYPTDLRQIAAVTPVSLPAPAPPPAVTQPAPAPAAPEPQAEEITPQQQQAPAEIAQNEPPPPAPEPAPQAAPAEPAQSQAADQSSSQSQSLPQTGSSFPLIGLGGVLCLSLYFGLRMKRLG